jgi:hypothetical protein
MSTNGIDMQVASTTTPQTQRRFRLSGLALRLLIAFVISWLIVMAFFVTGAVSH